MIGEHKYCTSKVVGVIVCAATINQQTFKQEHLQFLQRFNYQTGTQLL